MNSPERPERRRRPDDPAGALRGQPADARSPIASRIASPQIRAGRSAGAALRRVRGLVRALRAAGVHGARVRRHARAAHARFDLSQQLGELSCRRHGRAVSDAGREPPAGAPRGSARSAERRASAFASRACSTSRITKAAASSSKARAAWCSIACTASRTRAFRRAPISTCSATSRSSSTTRSSRSKREDAGGAPIYHTNVLMCVGARFAAICSECIREDERAAVLDALRSTGHAIRRAEHRAARALRRQHARAALRAR